MVPLARSVAGVGGASTLDFTGIEADYENLRLSIQGRGDNASTDIDVLIRFNNDSAANYRRQNLSTGSSSAAGQADAQTSGAVGRLAGATATAGAAGAITVDILGYARTVFNKLALARSFVTFGTGANTRSRTDDTEWKSTAAITRVTLIPSAGNFAQGTTAVLYGVVGDPT